MVIPKSRATYSKIVIKGRTGGAAELATRKGAAAQRQMPQRCDDKGTTGGATMKGAVAPMKGAVVRQRRQNQRPDDKGRNGGAMMKAAVARQGRQRRRDDKGRNGGATTKGAAAR